MAGFEAVWSRLSDGARGWLTEHNGEPVPEPVVLEIVAATADGDDPWLVEDDEGDLVPIDAASDWIDEAANGEHPGDDL